MPNYIKQLQEARAGVEQSRKAIAEQEARLAQERAERQAQQVQQVQQSAPQNYNEGAPQTDIGRMQSSALGMSQAEQDFLNSLGQNPDDTQKSIDASIAQQEQKNPQAYEQEFQDVHGGTSSKTAHRFSNYSKEEQDAYDYLRSQGVDSDNVMDFLETGEPIEQESGTFNTLWNSGEIAGQSILKNIADLTALPSRIGESIFGKGSADYIPPFPGFVHLGSENLNKLNEFTEDMSKVIEQEKNNGHDITVSLNKNNGQIDINDNGGLVQEFSTGLAEFAPDLLTMYATGGGSTAMRLANLATAKGASKEAINVFANRAKREAAKGLTNSGFLIGSKNTSAHLQEYELTEGEDNTIDDVFASMLRGGAEGALLRFTPTMGNKVTAYISPRLSSCFSKLTAKLGTNGAKRVMAEKFANFLARESGGLAGGEAFMGGSTLVGDLTNLSKDAIEGRDKHNVQLGRDILESLKTGAFWHLAGKAQNLGGRLVTHPLRTTKEVLTTPFRVAGKYRPYKEAQQVIEKTIKDNECGYNGENKVKTATYNGDKYFVREDSGDTATLVNMQTFEVKKVNKNDSGYKPDNAGVKKLSTFVGDYMASHMKPTIPSVMQAENGNLYWRADDGKVSRIGEVKGEDDGKLFTVYNEEGKPELKIYNADDGNMQSISDYLYRKELNKREENETDNVEEQPQQAEEQPTATDSNTETIQPQVQPTTDSPIEVGSQDFTANYADSEGEYTILTKKGGDKYILPNDASQPALRVNIGEDELTLENSGEVINPAEYDASAIEKADIGKVKALLGLDNTQPTDNNVNSTIDNNDTIPTNNASDSSVDNQQTNVAEPEQQVQPIAQEIKPIIKPNSQSWEFNTDSNASPIDVYNAHHSIMGDNPSADEVQDHIDAIDYQIKDLKKKGQFASVGILRKAKDLLEADVANMKALEAQAKEQAKTAQLQAKTKEEEKRANIRARATHTRTNETIEQTREVKAKIEKAKADQKLKETEEKAQRTGNRKRGSEKVVETVIEDNRNNGTNDKATTAVEENVKRTRKKKESVVEEQPQVIEQPQVEEPQQVVEPTPTGTSNVEEKPTTEEGQQNVEQTHNEETPSFEDSEDLFGLQLMDELGAKQNAEGEQKFNNDLAKIHGYAREKYKVNQLNELRKSVEKDELLSNKKKTELLSRIDNLIKAHSGERLGLGVTPEEIQKLDVTGENIKTACMLLESSFRGREDQTLNQLINEIEYGKEQVESRRNEVSSNESIDYINHLLDLANERIAEVERYIKKDEKPLNEIQKKVDSLNKEIEKAEGNNYTDEYTGNEGRLTDVSFNYADGTITYKIDGKSQSKKFDSDLGYLDSIVDGLKKSLKANNKPTPPDNNGGGKPEENGNKENSKSFVDENSKTPVKVTTETGKKAKEALYKAIDDASRINNSEERRSFMTKFFQEKIAPLGVDKPTLMKVYKAFVTDGRYPLDFKGATEEQKEVKDKNTGGWHEMKTADGKETLFEHLKKISHNSSSVSKLRDNEKYKLTDVQKKEVDAAVKKLNENSHKGEDVTPLLDKILHDQKNNGVSVEELIKTLKTNKKKYEEQGYNVKSFDEEIKKREQVVENKARAEKRFKEENKESKESVEEKIKRIVNTALKARRKEVDSNEDKKNMKELLDRVLDEYGRENSKTSLEDALRNAILNDKGEVTFFNSEAEVRKFGKLIGKDLSKDIAASQAHFIACADAASIVTTREENPQNVNVVKHPLSQKALDHLKKALEGTGLFSKVKFLSNDGIIRRFGMLAGKKAEQTLRDSNGTLLGFLGKDGTIYLNSESLDADTAVHEVAHTLFRAYENVGGAPEGFWDKATALADSCGALAELPSVYDKLSLRDRVEEALVRAIGERGGLRLQGSLWERFKDLAKHKWLEVLSYFGNEKAKTNLTWGELADEYAKKITDGTFEEKERKALEKAQFDAESCMKEMADGIEEIAGNKLAVVDNTKPGLWNTDEKYKRKLNHYLSILNPKGLTAGKESTREYLSRMLFDSLDSIFRVNVDIHKAGGYITEDGDYVEAAAVSQAVIRSLTEKFTNNQVLNYEETVNDIYNIIKGKAITDMYGNEVINVKDKPTLQRLVSDYLICKNACNGRNDMTYEEIVAAELKKAFGEEDNPNSKGEKGKKIEENAREARNAIKNVKRTIKGLNDTIKHLQEKIDSATTENKKEVVETATKQLREALSNKRILLDLIRSKANNIKTYARAKAKYDFEKKQEELHPEDKSKRADFVPTEEMKDFGTLGLSDRELNGLDYEGLKKKAKEVTDYVDKINEYIIEKKVTEKLEAEKAKFKAEIEADKNNMPASEWLHNVWEKQNPGLAPIYKYYGKDLEKAKKEGFMLGDERVYVQKYKTDGCGVSNRQAKDFCDRFEQLVGKKTTDSLSTRVKAITDYTIKTAYDGELISEQEYNKLKERNEKQFYVPMRSFEYDPKDTENDYVSMLLHDGTGADRSITTKAEGRTSKAADAYKSMLNMAYSSISAARVNKDVINYYKFMGDVLARRGKQSKITDKGLKQIQNMVSVGKWKRRKVGETKWEETEFTPDIDKLSSGENLLRDGDYEYMFESGNLKEFARNNFINQTKAKAHSVNGYVGGKKVTMLFSEARVANAFNRTHQRLSNIEKNAFLDLQRKITAFQSKCLTSYSVRFAFANHERDLGTYVLRLAGSGYKNVTKNIFRSYSDIFQAVMLGKDPKITYDGKTMTIHELLNENGLATGYIETNKQNSAEGLKKKIDEYRQDNGPRLKRDEYGRYTKEVEKTFTDRFEDITTHLAELADKGTPESIHTAMRTTFEMFGKAVELGKVPPELVSRMAEFLELVPRYAAFRTAMDNGATLKEAVRFGKNITTNFNRSGDFKYTWLGRWLYSSVPFFNAAMQGIKMAHDMTQEQTKRTTYAMIGMLALGLFANEFDRWFYGKNGYGADKVSLIDDYNRGSSIRIPLGGDHYLPIYMPHFFRMPLDAAMSLSDYAHGERSLEDTLWSLGGSLADITHWDFSKAGKEGGFWDIAEQTFAPGYARPFIDVARNRNFFGSNIYKEPYKGENSTNPEWQNTFGNSTLPMYVDFTRSLNEFGGGNDEYGAGWVYQDGNGVIKPNITENNKSKYDLNPQAMQYIISNLLPFMQYADNTYKAYAKTKEKNGGESLSIKDWLSIVPKGLQLDKITYKELPDEEMSASQLIYKAQKYFDTIKGIKESGETPHTAEQAQEIIAWENVSLMQKDIKKIKKAATIADANGNSKMASALAKVLADREIQMATYLYQLETERDLHDSQKTVKHWFENLTK